MKARSQKKSAMSKLKLSWVLNAEEWYLCEEGGIGKLDWVKLYTQRKNEGLGGKPKWHTLTSTVLGEKPGRRWVSVLEWNERNSILEHTNVLEVVNHLTITARLPCSPPKAHQTLWNLSSVWYDVGIKYTRHSQTHQDKTWTVEAQVNVCECDSESRDYGVTYRNKYTPSNLPVDLHSSDAHASLLWNCEPASGCETFFTWRLLLQWDSRGICQNSSPYVIIPWEKWKI